MSLSSRIQRMNILMPAGYENALIDKYLFNFIFNMTRSTYYVPSYYFSINYFDF